MTTGIKINGQLLTLDILYLEEEELSLDMYLGSNLIGGVIFQKEYNYAGDAHDTFEESDDFVYLESIWVHSDYRQNGIANYLMPKGLLEVQNIF